MLCSDWSGPDTWEEQSGKLATLTCLLVQLTNDTTEKIVLVSLSTSTLDLLESLCQKYCFSVCRLDGNTPAQVCIFSRFHNKNTVSDF